MKYTEAVHAKRLLMMLDDLYPCDFCPSVGFDAGVKQCCGVCRDFIGLDFFKTTPYCNEIRCPCLVLGNHEAIKRTWLALEEKGYI